MHLPTPAIHGCLAAVLHAPSPRGGGSPPGCSTPLSVHPHPTQKSDGAPPPVKGAHHFRGGLQPRCTARYVPSSLPVLGPKGTGRDVATKSPRYRRHPCSRCNLDVPGPCNVHNYASADRDWSPMYRRARSCSTRPGPARCSKGDI